MKKLIFVIFILSIWSTMRAQDKSFVYVQNNHYGLLDSLGHLQHNFEYTNIEDLEQNDWYNTHAFVFTKKDKKGLANRQGVMIYPIEYDGIQCKDSKCILSKNGKFGYGDLKGNIFIPIQYDGLGYLNEDKIKAKIGDKIGFLNEKNEWVISPVLDGSVYDFSEGLARICKSEDSESKTCGYIDDKGVLVIPQIYQRFSGDFKEGLASVGDYGEVTFINKEGKIVFTKNNYNIDYPAEFKYGLIQVSNNCKHYDDYSVCEHYLLDKTGKNILPKNALLDETYPELNRNVVRTNGLNGVIDNMGKIIIPIEYGEITVEEDRIIAEDEDYFLYFNLEGKLLLKTKLHDSGNYIDGKDSYHAFSNYDGGGEAVLDSNYKTIIPPEYENIDLKEGIFKVTDFDYKCGYLDKKGNTLISLQYADCNNFNKGITTVLDMDSKWKIIDKNNKVLTILDNDLQDVTQFANGVAAASSKKIGKEGFIDTQGNKITDFIYDYTYHYEDVIIVEKNQKKGVLNKQGKLIIPMEYDDININTCRNTIITKKNDKNYFFDLEGKQKTDIIYLNCYSEDGDVDSSDVEESDE